MRLSAMLTPIDDGLWGLGSFFVTWGCRGSLRMSVLKTSQGLLLYSPVALTARDVDDIGRIGTVATIVAPNLFHHFHLRAAMAAFPDARVLIPEGLEAKIGPVAGAVTIARDTRVAPPDEIDSCTFAGHYLRETVLFHRPTGSMITADLMYNYQREHFRAEKLFFGALGCYGAPNVPFYHRFAIADRTAVRDLIDTVRRWAPRRIVMSHGRIFESPRAAEVFATVWSRFA